MNKHTPGPWDKVERKNDRTYIGTSQKPIADVCNLYGEESEANLALIEAAPDMYEALFVCLKILYEVKGNIDKFINHPANKEATHAHDLSSNVNAAILAAEKATAKAEGRRG